MSTSINPVNGATYVPQATSAVTATTTAPAATPTVQDVVQLSLAGRIALGESAGRLTSDQGQQLDAQLKNISQQIQSGGATDINQLQHQLSEQIYGDGHNGAAIPADLTVTVPVARDFVQAGRIVTQENAGNLTSTQASGFFSQIKQIYQQSQNGASFLTTTKAQNQLSAEIYDAAHNVTPPS
jgi:hypothetical protein